MNLPNRIITAFQLVPVGRFYFMKFIKPTLPKNQKGVYQLTFDEKWFYIGSSICLKSRATAWGTRLLNGKYLKSINIQMVIPKTEIARFEVISTHVTEKEIRKAETKLLKEQWSNPFLLNCCPIAGRNKGQRHHIGYIAPVKIKKKIIDIRKRVAVFNKGGELIKICQSFLQLEKEYKIKGCYAKKIFNGEKGQPKKITIKQVLPDDSIKEPDVFINKSERSIRQYSMDGLFIAEYKSTTEAAKRMGGHRSHLSNALRGVYHHKTFKGYIWKYA